MTRLEALIQKPDSGCDRYPPNGFLESGKIPQDAWDNDLYYESDGKKFKVVSFGADGEEGGEGFDEDIDSSQL